jgi:peptidoglycan-associated lipoprotein
MLKTTRLLTLSAVMLGVVMASGCHRHPNANGSNMQAKNENGTAGDQTYAGGAGTTGQFGPDGTLSANETYHFNFDSAVVREEDAPRVRQQGSYIASKGNAKVRLEGHTDERGSREYNIGLGHRRANSVKQTIEAQGARPTQIETVSYGAERPIAQGQSEEAYAENRRVELSYEGNSPQQNQQS